MTDDPIRVDPIDQPSPLETRIPVPEHGSLFTNPATLEAISRANLAAGAVDAYARARHDAPHTARLWDQPIPATLGTFIEWAADDACYRHRRSPHTIALMIPAWVADWCAQHHHPMPVPLLEIPMNPTAPWWAAVAIASDDDRTPSLVRPQWRPLARYRCPALPEHLEALEASPANTARTRHPQELERLARHYKPTPEQVRELTDAAQDAIDDHNDSGGGRGE